MKYGQYNSYLNSVLFKNPELKENIQLNFPFVEELLHLYLSFIELLEDRLNVADGTIVWCFIVRDRRISVAKSKQMVRNPTLIKTPRKDKKFSIL